MRFSSVDVARMPNHVKLCLLVMVDGGWSPACDFLIMYFSRMSDQIPTSGIRVIRGSNPNKNAREYSKFWSPPIVLLQLCRSILGAWKLIFYIVRTKYSMQWSKYKRGRLIFTARHHNQNLIFGCGHNRRDMHFVNE